MIAHPYLRGVRCVRWLAGQSCDVCALAVADTLLQRCGARVPHFTRHPTAAEWVALGFDTSLSGRLGRKAG